MSRSKTQNSIYNAIGGLIYKGIAVIFPFLIRMVMIKKLGVEYLGLNSLFTSILMILSLSELGVGSALVYSMYKPMAEGDEDRVCALLNVYRKFYRFIGGVILLIGLLLLPFLKYIVKGDCPSDLNLYILYCIYLGNTVVSYFLFAYKKSLLEASQQNGVDSKLAALTTAIMYIMQIIVLSFFASYYAYIIVMPICTIALNILRSKRVDKMFPQYKCVGELEKGFVKGLFVKISSLLGHKIGSTVVTASDSIVISSVLGLTILAKYSNYYQVINAIIGMVTVFYHAITASVGNSIIMSEKKKVEETFYTLSFMNNWLVGWCSICLLCLYQPFMKIWMGEEMLFPFSTVVLFAIYLYAWLIRRIGLTYKDAAGMWEQDFWKPYVGIIVNLGTSIALAHYIGVEGVIIGTIVVMVLIYFPWETYVLHKHLFMHSSKAYLIKMLSYIIGTLVAAGITYIMCSLVNDAGIGPFIIKMLICVFIPNIIFGVFYSRTREFNSVYKRVLLAVKSKMH